jgi:hypothetical protein
MAMDQGKITRFSLVCMYGKAAYTQAAMARRMEHRNPCIACMSLPAGDCGSQITDARDKSESATEQLLLF